MDPGDRQRAAAIEGPERDRDELAGWCEQDRGVEELGRLVGRVTRRGASELEGERPGGRTARQDVDRRAPMDRELGGQVSRSAEAVDAEPTTIRNHRPLERAISDDAGTQQRGRRHVVEIVRQAVGVRLRHDRVFGVPAIVVPTREAWRQAEVLAAGRTEPTRAARAPQPRDADPLAGDEPIGVLTEEVDIPDDLVAGNDARTMDREVTRGDVQVGATHAARGHPDADLGPPGDRDGSTSPHQRSLLDGSRPIDRPDVHLGGSGM